MARTQVPDRTATRTLDGDDVDVRVYRSDPEYAGRIEIDAGECWTFGVDETGVADVVSAGGDGGVPDWVQALLHDAGVLAIDGVGEVA